MVEAYYIKKTLMENNWDETCLFEVNKINKTIPINKKIKGSTPQITFKFCPDCGNKIKNSDEICPICGINLKK